MPVAWKTLLPLLGLVIGANLPWAAPARADHCEHIRQARLLAHRHRLEDRTLRRLEALYCGRSGSAAPPAAEREDCLRLSVMAELAAAVDADPRITEQIAAGHAAACRLPDVDGHLREWPDGSRARSWDGNSWWYPNGQRAYSHGTWYYPDGSRARSASGSWYYPGGSRARSASGTWYAPGGRRMRSGSELVAWACHEAGAGVCRGTLDEAHFGTAEQQVAAAVRVAWLASRSDRASPPVVVLPALPVGVLYGGPARR